MTRRKAPHEKLKPGPKPGFKRVQQEPPQAAAAPAVPQAVADAPRQSRDALQRHRNMDLMGEDELRDYAVQIGVQPRDAATLAPDRLKQNCRLVLDAVIEDLVAA